MTVRRQFFPRRAASVGADRVGLRLPPAPVWLGLVADACARFGAAHGLTPALTDMVSQSVAEACEELLRVAAATGVSEPFELVLYRDAVAAVADLVYSDALPLDPLHAAEYEPPRHADLDRVDPESLWLHLIKSRMDRVYFRVDGTRRILRMIKYRREPGREQEEWVLGLRPSLALDAVLCPVAGNGEPDREGARDREWSCMLENTATGAAMRLTPVQAEVVSRLDGSVSFHDIAIEASAQGLAVNPAYLAALYDTLREAGMLADQAAPAVTKGWREVLRAYLAPSFSFPDPDAAAMALYRVLGFLAGPTGAVLLLCAGLSGLLPAWRDFPRMAEFASDIDLYFWANPGSAVIVYLLFLVLSAARECARALACKHYGGKVTGLGVMFYGPAFFFYCDVTASAALPSRLRRAVVGFSGTLVTAAFLGASLWAWEASLGHLAQTSLCGFAFVCLGALVCNLNPFLRMDAYRVLAGVTGIPDLRRRSFTFLKDSLFRRTGFEDLAGRGPAPAPRERRLFLAYAVIGLVVTVVGIVIPSLRFVHVLLEDSPRSAQVFLTAVSLVLVLARVAGQAMRQIHAVFHRVYSLK